MLEAVLFISIQAVLHSQSVCIYLYAAGCFVLSVQAVLSLYVFISMLEAVLFISMQAVLSLYVFIFVLQATLTQCVFKLNLML